MSKGMRRSVATIDSPEFINITQMSNPLISECEIKVFYVGENRNHSYISKEVATQMAQTLPGCPIVGYYIENKEDFGDHGDQIIIDSEGVKFNKLTKPYGFVAPDAKVWFQKFEDTDDFGNTVIREYLMTTGYLWTGQFEEAKRVLEKGNPQSMEIDDKTLQGYWSTDYNKGIDFFIINDAIFSKLCILGEDVEPCFEGANVTAPASSFSKQDDFTTSLFTMMEQLKYTLNNKGGLSMENIETPIVEETTVENFSKEEGNVDKVVTSEFKNNTEEEKEKEEEKKDSESNSASEAPEKEEDEEEKKEKISKNTCNNEEDEEKDKEAKKKFELLQNEFNELQEKYALLEKENQKLSAFKLEVESKQKDDMINSFYMLSDEDKKDVIDNKAKYSLDDIKAKLSIICVDKKVNFNLDKEETKETTAPITYTLDNSEVNNIPAWIRAVEDARNRIK